MSKGFKIFLLSFLLSLPFWWGVNLLEKPLEDFFFWQEIGKNPEILTAQVSSQLMISSLRPTRDWTVEDFETEAKSTEAKSAVSVLINNQDQEKVLFAKEIDKKLPIASLTKLMTAFVVLENYDLSQMIEISKEAVEQDEDFGNFKIGETFLAKDLLYPLLIESSNDAAYALAEVISVDGFVDLMNFEAQKLGLADTYFVNPTGLDPKDQEQPVNYTTVEDLVKLTNYLLKIPLIWEILSAPEYDFYSPDGVFHHKLINTNELLKNNEIEIIGGKTGWTPRAQGCLLLVTKAPKSKGYLVNIILGSKNRFEEMKKLLDWLNNAYRW